MLILFVLLVVVPLAEIAGFILIGELIGLWPTLLTVVATALIGGALLRQQGIQTLNRARAELAQHRMPMQSLFDGLYLFASGLLLLTPGFFTDLVGFVLLIPAVRLLIAERMVRHLESQPGVNVTIRGTWQEEPEQPRSPDPRSEQDPSAVDPSLPPVSTSRWGRKTGKED